jgi:thiamine-monophosphate kinase
MDISDGLAKDLDRLARASGLRALVRGRDIPLSDPLRRALAAAPSLFSDVVTGGDDYEVLAAISPADCEAFSAAALAEGLRVTKIGVLEAGEGIAIDDPAGRALILDKPGWEHF